MTHGKAVDGSPSMVNRNKRCKRFAVCGNMVGEGRRAEYCIRCSNTRNVWNKKAGVSSQESVVRKGKAK